MKTFRRTFPVASATLSVIFALVAGASNGVAASPDRGDATYSVVFVPSWNPASHPPEYPLSHAKQGLLTPIIGATHGSRYRLFAEGTKPSVGLETLSETGKHNPLDDEIRRAISAGQATSLIEFADGSPGPVHAPVSHVFEITRAQPYVSLAGMIAPSPDWFYGVSAVDLLQNGNWVPSAVVTAYAWDSGGDAGETYLAEDMDLATKESTRRVQTPHFVQQGQTVPVGVFVFKRIPADR